MVLTERSAICIGERHWPTNLLKLISNCKLFAMAMYCTQSPATPDIAPGCFKHCVWLEFYLFYFQCLQFQSNDDIDIVVA